MPLWDLASFKILHLSICSDVGVGLIFFHLSLHLETHGGWAGSGEWVWISPSEEHSSAFSKERDS